MEYFLLFLLSSIGMTLIIVESNIFQKVRDWVQIKSPNFFGEMITCSTCTGFWVGLITGFLCVSHNLFIVFLCGCTSSFISTWASIYLTYLSNHTNGN